MENIIGLFFLLIPVILVTLICIFAPMPGRIAKKRNHPQAKVIRLCGWTALLSSNVSAWTLAMMWAHHDSLDSDFQSRIADVTKKSKRKKDLYSSPIWKK